MFSGNTPFGKVINEFIHPVYKDTTNTYTDRRGYNWSDGLDSDIGRYINNNDTIYWEGKYITDNNTSKPHRKYSDYHGICGISCPTKRTWHRKTKWPDRK